MHLTRFRGRVSASSFATAFSTLAVVTVIGVVVASSGGTGILIAAPVLAVVEVADTVVKWDA